jgi:hypothetical protein
MPETNVPDQPGVFAEITSGLTAGLPAFRSIDIDFATSADLRQWAARFDVEIPATVGQPYPNSGLADPWQATDWLISEYREWRGLPVRLHCLDPITDDQRRHWIDSGKAADRAKYLADLAARKAPTHPQEMAACARGDETGPSCSPECNDMYVEGAPDGLARAYHHDDCPVLPALEAAEHRCRHLALVGVTAVANDDKSCGNRAVYETTFSALGREFGAETCRGHDGQLRSAPGYLSSVALP